MAMTGGNVRGFISDSGSHGAARITTVNNERKTQMITRVLRKKLERQSPDELWWRYMTCIV